MNLIGRTPERNTPSDFFPWYRPKRGDQQKVYSLFTMVVSMGPAQDWTVYYGPLAWTPEEVASKGDKLPRNAALALFPNIEGEYRD